MWKTADEGFWNVLRNLGNRTSERQGRRYLRLVEEAKLHVTEIEPECAAVEVKRGALFLDVRESVEFHRGHAAESLHLGRERLEAEIERLAPDVNIPILCICARGNRSALAAETLQRMGYGNVKSVRGGIEAWQEAGLPMERKRLLIED